MSLISSGCALTTKDAATLKGQIAAGVTLPDWPDECYKKEAHAALSKDADVRSILKRERAQLKKQNARGDLCSKYYDELKKQMAAPK